MILAEVNDQLRTYFGDMTPAQHSIQHSNWTNFLIGSTRFQAGSLEALFPRLPRS